MTEIRECKRKPGRSDLAGLFLSVGRAGLGSGRLRSGVIGAALTLAPETKAVTGLLRFGPGRWLTHFEEHGAKFGARTSVEYLPEQTS